MTVDNACGTVARENAHIAREECQSEAPWKMVRGLQSYQGMKTITTILTGIVTLALAAGCSVEPPTQVAPQPRLPAPDANNEYHVTFPDLGRGAARYIGLTLGDDLASTCGLMRAHFEFDSSSLLPVDELAMKSIAECLNRSEIRDKDLAIIGRADARGNAGYNVALGQKRAEAVRDALIGAGVSPSRLQVTTRGAADARGDDKLFSYGYDRRVDMVLIGVAHKPR